MGNQLITEYDLMMRAQKVALGQMLDRQAREDLSTTETARYLQYLSNFRSLGLAIKTYRTYQAYERYLLQVEQNYQLDAYLLGYDPDTQEQLPPEKDKLLQEITKVKLGLTIGKGRAKQDAAVQLNHLFWMFVDKKEYKESKGYIITEYTRTVSYEGFDVADKDFKMEFVEEAFKAMRNDPYSETPAVDEMVENIEKARKTLTQAQRLFSITVLTFISDVISSIHLI